MTFTDHGIGLCSCGTERRLYAPETQPEARWCLPCVKSWSLAQTKPKAAAIQRRNQDYRRRQAEYQKRKRDRCRATGVCWTCTKLPAVEGKRECVACLARSVAYQRARKQTASLATKWE